MRSLLACTNIMAGTFATLKPMHSARRWYCPWLSLRRECTKITFPPLSYFAVSVNSRNSFSDYSENEQNRKIFELTLFEDLFSETAIERDNAGERFFINPLLKVCEIVRIFSVIVTLIEFLKDYSTAGSSFLIGCHFIIENVCKSKLVLDRSNRHESWQICINFRVFEVYHC